ncbi:hypothetical protein [Insolitispirillum peregrinum]|uniref:hypothetical protein n=1 Tax=Insolitispirillum peregrinum TaxID=80876 RepID=UPI001115569B|nr:hypothetical protein [Insolitispirillum peregrinum]
MQDQKKCRPEKTPDGRKKDRETPTARFLIKKRAVGGNPQTWFFVTGRECRVKRFVTIVENNDP